MNISEPLPEYIELEYQDEIWQQPLDYEHIPFRCRQCHEYGHLIRKCPQNREEETIKKQEEEKKRAEKNRGWTGRFLGGQQKEENRERRRKTTRKIEAYSNRKPKKNSSPARE